MLVTRVFCIVDGQEEEVNLELAVRNRVRPRLKQAGERGDDVFVCQGGIIRMVGASAGKQVQLQ